MFERFTRDAREVVIGAVALAGELGQSHVGPEHLAASLLPAGGRAADLLAAHEIDEAVLREAAAGNSRILSDAEIEALRSVGVNADEVLRRIEEEFGPQAAEAAPVRGRARRRPMRRESLKVMQQSLRQAQRLRSRELGTEHILLALLAQDQPDPATRLIQQRGLTYETVKASLAG